MFAHPGTIPGLFRDFPTFFGIFDVFRPFCLLFSIIWNNRFAASGVPNIHNTGSSAEAIRGKYYNASAPYAQISALSRARREVTALLHPKNRPKIHRELNQDTEGER